MTGGSQGLWSFPRRRPWRAIAYGVAACALGVSACGGGQPATRGFGSSEIQPIRDSTLVLEGEDGPGVLIYGTGGPGGGAPASANYWTLNLSTGGVQNYGSQYPPLPSSSPPPPPSPYTCTANFYADTSTFMLQIVDNSTGAETDVDVVSYAQCPGADGTLTAFTVDASGNTVLSTGPFTALAPVPLSLQVGFVDSWTYDPVTSVPTAVMVRAALPSAPDQFGVYTIDLASYAITANIPAIPASVAWAAGAISAGSLQSTSVVGQGRSSVGDHYLYPRKMSDAGTTMFAGPFSSGAVSELALFQIPPGTQYPMGWWVVSSPSSAGYVQGSSQGPRR